MIPDELVDRALATIGNRSNYEYFFSRLTSPEWIEPLLKRNFFRDPAKPERVGDGIRYPLWPESQYLARVAAEAPEEVLQIALQIPETDNFRVHTDLAQAAQKMPAAMAATWVRKEIAWITNQPRLVRFWPEELGRLVTHLVKGGEIDTAFDLAKTLLEPRAPMDKPEGDETLRWPGNPLLRVDPYDYSELLRLRVPDLGHAKPLETLAMLSDFLETAIRIYLRDEEAKAEPSADYSFLWRPAIEDNDANKLHEPYDIKVLLTVAMRDLAEGFIHQNTAFLPRVVELLEQRGWQVFQRLGLHLLMLFADTEEGQPLIAERLTNVAALEAIDELRELGLLLQNQFGSLSDGDQEKVLRFIGSGFDPEAYVRGYETAMGTRPTEENIAEARDHWQVRRLSRISDHLTGDWKKSYDSLVSARGAPEYEEFRFSSATWVGPTSPRSDEELASMTIEELVEFLKEWRPSGEFATPSPDGLGRALAAQVRSRPDQFADKADLFVGLEPTYARSVLDGLVEAVGQGLSFEWSTVLRLARWIVEQPRQIVGRSEEQTDDSVDPSLGWSRKSVARLLGIGFESQTVMLPAELRALAWEILRPITDDPDPTPEHEERYGGSNMDPLTLSINTTRGEAMHSVVRYCLWVRRQFEGNEDAERLEHGFGEMPEAREVLEAHLDPIRDPSVAVRAVYGQWLPWLALLDEGWTVGNLPRLFPDDPNLLPLREAVWDTYIVVNKAYKNALGLLRDQYAWAVDRIGSETRVKSHLGDPDTAVARHLVVYYWQGSLDLDDSSGLLARFYEKAPDSVRGDAIDFIGRSLAQTPDTPPDVADRLRLLWESRLAAASETDREEMAGFGWWFVSERFPDDWLVTNLRDALRKGGKVEPAHKVAERLAQIAEAFPLITVECLRYMVRGDEEGWGVQHWRDDAKRILSTALNGNDEEARKAARDLTNELGARGHWYFRDLVQNLT